jgi:hypothetical protein
VILGDLEALAPSTANGITTSLQPGPLKQGGCFLRRAEQGSHLALECETPETRNTATASSSFRSWRCGARIQPETMTPVVSGALLFAAAVERAEDGLLNDGFGAARHELPFGVAPWVYLADVLVEIVNDHPHNAIDDLFPRAYVSPEPSKPWPQNAAYIDPAADTPAYRPDSIVLSSRNRILPSLPASEITNRSRPWLEVSA